MGVYTVGMIRLERDRTSWYLCGLVAKGDKDMDTLDNVKIVYLSGGSGQKGFIKWHACFVKVRSRVLYSPKACSVVHLVVSSMLSD